MKNIILFCLIGLSLAAQSPKHFLGFTISPAATDVIHKTFDEHFPASLYEGTFFIGGSVGASMLWQLHPRIRLQTDLVYSVYSERQKRAFNPISNDPVFGFILEPNDEAYIVQISEYHTLSAPILVNIYLNDQRSKWAWFASTGARAHMSLNRYSTFIPDEKFDLERSRSRVENSDNKPFRVFNVSAQVGFGADYNASQSFRFRIAPFFERFFLNTLPSSNFRSEIPYALGVTFGAYWQI